MITASANVDTFAMHRVMPGEFSLVHKAHKTQVMGQYHSFCGLAFFEHEVKDDDRAPTCLLCVAGKNRNE